jgi:hypothetical protein
MFYIFTVLFGCVCGAVVVSHFITQVFQKYTGQSLDISVNCCLKLFQFSLISIESRWGARFSAPVQTGPGAHPASCTKGTGSFLGVKRPGRGADHPPPSSAEIMNEQSYTSSPPLGLRGLL